MTATVSAQPLHAHLGDPWRIAALLETPGAVCTGHYRLLAGQHSDRFVRFSQLAKNPEALSYFADLLAARMGPHDPAGVVAPSTAGVALGVEIARRLSARLYLASVGEDGRANALIGVSPPEGARLLLVNDVVTTGDGLRALASVVGAAGAEVVGGAAFLCRSAMTLQDVEGVPLSLVATVPFESWSPSSCPLCQNDEEPEDARDLN